jgi:hypothetical protein
MSIFRKSGYRFSAENATNKQRMIPKSGNRFPACAKPWYVSSLGLDASAGEGRSEKIMRQQKDSTT